MWKILIHCAIMEDLFIIAEILLEQLLVLINIHLWKTLFNLKMFFKMLAKIAPLGGYAEF